MDLIKTKRVGRAPLNKKKLKVMKFGEPWAKQLTKIQINTYALSQEKISRRTILCLFPAKNAKPKTFKIG